MILKNHSWDIVQPLAIIVNNRLTTMQTKGELLLGGNGMIGMIYATLPMKPDLLKNRVILWANFVGIYVQEHMTPESAWELLGASQEWDVMCMQPLTWEEIQRRSTKYGGTSVSAYELFLLSNQSQTGRRIGVGDLVPMTEGDGFDDSSALTTFNAVADKVSAAIKRSNKAEKRSVRIERGRESVKVSWIAGMMLDYSVKLTLSTTSFAVIDFRADDRTTSGSATSEDDLNSKISALMKSLGVEYS